MTSVCDDRTAAVELVNVVADRTGWTHENTSAKVKTTLKPTKICPYNVNLTKRAASAVFDSV